MKESTTENFRPAVRAIAYIESQLSMPCDLQKVAEQAGYSKYYLHRLFSKETGMTPCQYIRRRKLTEAARLLVFSKQPIMDIALAAGYESRQAFTGIFKELYKKTPGQYRKDGFFYPLQLRYPPEEFPDGAPEPAGKAGWEDGAREQGRRGSRIRTASEKDMGKWMELVRLVIDGYPCLEEEAYKETLRQNIRQKRALILEHNDKAAGIMAFDESRGFIDFLGIHPGYRGKGGEELLLEEAFDRLTAGDSLVMTTFREGDKADLGHRRRLKKLGFTEAEPLVEFGYPTQKMILSGQTFRERNSREADRET